MKNFIFFFLINLTICALFGWALHVWATTPIIQFSWSTQECVAVVYGEGSCEDLPERYEREWIK